MTTKMTKTMMAILTTMATATPAMAGDFGLLLNINRNSGHAPNVSLGISTARHRPTIVRRIWVAPIYETVVQRIWVPTVQTAYRDVPVTNLFGRIISYRREPYTIETGYWTQVPQQVLVRNGYWTTTPVSRRRHSNIATVRANIQNTIRNMAPGVRTRNTASATRNTPRNNRRSQTTRPIRTLARNR